MLEFVTIKFGCLFKNDLLTAHLIKNNKKQSGRFSSEKYNSVSKNLH